VEDFEWRADGHLFLTLVEEEERVGGASGARFVAAGVKLNRIKRHYLENYTYSNAVTRDT